MQAMGKSSLYVTIFGNDKSKKAFDSFNRSTNQANQQIKRLAGAVAAAFSVREVVEAANVMIGVENRMNALTGSATETASAMNHMRRIASDSRSDFDAVAMLFTRLALATEHLGATQKDVADATQTVANTFIIAGSHAQEANNSARQLAQGLASGALRGDELRSVMENNTILTKMLADGLDMTIGELREFGHAGKLTAETVMPILIKGTKETNEQISKMPMTLGQAGVALRNNFQFMIGDIQKATNGFSTLSAIIGKFANNLDVILIPALAVLGAMLPKIITMTKAFTAAALANPFVLIPAALAALYVFRNEFFYLLKFINKQLNIFDLNAKIFVNNLSLSFLDKFIVPIKTAFTGFMNFIIDGLNTGIDKINGLIDKLPEKIKDTLGIGKLPTIELFGDIESEEKSKEIKARIESLYKDLEKETNRAIDKVKIKSFMDLITGRDPNDPGDEGDTGFKALAPFEKFLKAAEEGYSDFATNIKTMQEELQGVFKKSYDGLTQLTMDFLEKGKASFKDYATSIVRELIRIAVQKLVIDRMFESFGGFLGKTRDRQIEIRKNLNLPTTIPTNEGGGFTGMGARAGGIDNKGGFLSILHPNETVIDHTKQQQQSQQVQAAPTVNFNISTVDAAGFDQLLASRKGLITSIINNAMNNQGKMGVV
jgi:tape measure domain-containing protein